MYSFLISSYNNFLLGEVPFFLYLALQNVHDPFNDFDDEYEYGLPDSYLPSDVLTGIEATTSGTSIIH